VGSLLNKLTVEDLAVEGRRVLVRVDFNVPQHEDGRVKDDRRIRAAIPTIRYLMLHGAKTILTSHLGQPKGKPDDKIKLTLRPVAERLSELLGVMVPLIPDCIGPQADAAIASMKPGEVILLENVRFHPGETKNDPEFASSLASMAELYVNDAFGTAHRANASTEGVAHYLKSAAGFLMQKELEYLGGALDVPKRPFVAVLGGAKIASKIGVVDNLLNKVDRLVIGGGMAYTFLKAQGKAIGNSKLEKEKLDLAKEILSKAKELKKDILLPIDNLVVEKIDPAANTEIVGDEIPEGKIAVDIGPKTIGLFEQKLKSAKTIVWNGPLGIFEMDPFAKGTQEIAKFIATLAATTIIGGGDTAAAVAKFKLEDKMTHISTGGGASLEFLEGKQLPGVVALTEK